MSPFVVVNWPGLEVVEWELSLTCVLRWKTNLQFDLVDHKVSWILSKVLEVYLCVEAMLVSRHCDVLKLVRCSLGRYKCK
ncbi:hypothetical protein RchiOBHm_Chr2g0165381 [Rosa chinensis]|uniref:Uncharacterized protein n=1 Tax=Rosa chinensis TaxID=74649 RepID=A0A2P6S3S6_ROSCH|nr:hypothetical protein RchiOBHm_Chr2g0165381 [Rosa chinensis]